MKTFVKECINSNCRNIFYIYKWQLGTCVQCEKCTEKHNKKTIMNTLFLLEKDSKTEVFAYFPDNITHGEFRQAYSHIGQHSDCHPEYANECIQAPYRRYKPLLVELQEIGYDNLNILNE